MRPTNSQSDSEPVQTVREARKGKYHITIQPSTQTCKEGLPYRDIRAIPRRLLECTVKQILVFCAPSFPTVCNFQDIRDILAGN